MDGVAGRRPRARRDRAAVAGRRAKIAGDHGAGATGTTVGGVGSARAHAATATRTGVGGADASRRGIGPARAADTRAPGSAQGTAGTTATTIEPLCA